ncbi:hypothetical protein AB205_0220550, partial [Aquarana catesbeiana]
DSAWTPSGGLLLKPMGSVYITREQHKQLKKDLPTLQSRTQKTGDPACHVGCGKVVDVAVCSTEFLEPFQTHVVSFTEVTEQF